VITSWTMLFYIVHVRY